MPNVELLLGSPLIRDALSALLAKAGFSVFREPTPPDGDTTVVIAFDDCLDPETIRAHQQRGAKIVVLASEADSLKMSDEQIAPLSGLLTDDLAADAFVRSLRLVCSGERVFPRTLVPGRDRPARPIDKELRGGADRLSAREREVLSHLVDGHSKKAIARFLGMSEATVKVHSNNVLRKIRVENRTQAAIWALANLPSLAKPLAALSELDSSAHRSV